MLQTAKEKETVLTVAGNSERVRDVSVALVKATASTAHYKVIRR